MAHSNIIDMLLAMPEEFPVLSGPILVKRKIEQKPLDHNKKVVKFIDEQLTVGRHFSL